MRWYSLSKLEHVVGLLAFCIPIVLRTPTVGPRRRCAGLSRVRAPFAPVCFRRPSEGAHKACHGEQQAGFCEGIKVFFFTGQDECHTLFRLACIARVFAEVRGDTVCV